ncbi:MAG: hypothetical protein ACK2T5_05955, partial [Anaerolineales bacterium]
TKTKATQNLDFYLHIDGLRGHQLVCATNATGETFLTPKFQSIRSKPKFGTWRYKLVSGSDPRLSDHPSFITAHLFNRQLAQ